MSEGASSVSSHDRLSKIIHRRCKQVADFIKGDEITNPTNPEKSSCQSDETSNREDDSETASDEDDEDSECDDLQGVLAEMEGKSVTSNKTFSEEKLREIERRNAMLMDKLIRNSQRPNQYKSVSIPTKVASAAINRRREQEKINRDNLVLEKDLIGLRKKIQ